MSGNSGTSSRFGGTPISTISGIAPAIQQKLESIGFLDSEQVVAAANVGDIKSRFAEALQVSPSEVDSLVSQLTAALPPAAAFMAGPPPNLAALSLGAMPPTPEIEAMQAALTPIPQMAAAPLPAAVNWISKLPQPKNQGARGTCVAFAMTAVHEHFVASTGNAADLSEQFLYHETKAIDGQPTVCGTWQVKAAQVLETLGQCQEADWPYNGQLPCNNNGVEPAHAKAQAAAFRPPMVTLPPRDLQSIKAALASGSLVGFSIPVYDSWYQNSYVAETGRITMRVGGEQPSGGHAMCFVGYQDEAASPGGGYFLLRNSWFGVWGMNCPFGAGYGSIPYAYIAAENWEAVTTAPPRQVPSS